MQNELAIRNYDSNRNMENDSNFSKLKMIANDSLFYFALFLGIVALLQFAPFFAGVLEDFQIGINEVVISLIGFANVFFLQVYHKLFRTVNNRSVS